MVNGREERVGMGGGAGQMVLDSLTTGGAGHEEDFDVSRFRPP